MKVWLFSALIALTAALALSGCPHKDTDSGTTPGTDSGGGGGTDSAVGTDAAFMCAMSGSTCAEYCTAYIANCSTDNNFPAGYDMTMCMADCAALTPAQLDCRGYHACFAGKGGVADADSHCDHAIGMMGFCM
ncbi:MAG TPA: hypothetical protein VG389_12160 [Myxococcota bacterium]|jgi:hypothetical protein|nr:hypothetical protein [Myxococcota bacterium]